MHEIRYEAPRSVREVTQLLQQGAGEKPRVLAGGTDLLVQMRTGRLAPGLVIDVKQVPEATSVKVDTEGARIGAAVSCAELRETVGLADRWPGLLEAAELIGSEQIQGRATLGGNLCNASPAADTVPAMIAVGARAEIVGPDGERSIPVEEFVTAPGENALLPGEFLVSLFLPAPTERTADAYLRLIPRSEMDIAVVGAGVSLTLDKNGKCTDARVALGAVAEKPLLVAAAGAALVGSKPGAAQFEAAAEAASAAASPIDDKRGTVAYRRRVTGVLTRRAAQIAFARAVARSNSTSNGKG